VKVATRVLASRALLGGLLFGGLWLYDGGTWYTAILLGLVGGAATQTFVVVRRRRRRNRRLRTFAKPS
jgi:hypothetical protein